ncbi:MAG: hypothetical protein ABH840_04670 [Nanoarchaeota archaeon]
MKKIKLVISVMFAVFVLALLVGSAFALGYVRICLMDGDSISITPDTYTSHSPDYRLVCGNGKCTAYLKSGSGYVDICVQEISEGLYYPPSLPSKCSGGCEFSSGNNNPDLTLTTIWPFSNGGYYTKQSFYLDIKTNQVANIALIDNVAGTQKTLCPNCNSYRRSKTFNEGLNDITIRSVLGLQIKEERMTFFIDNKKPRISKTLPTSNSFVGSIFTVYYDEQNLKNITLNYGVPGDYKSVVLSGCVSGIKQDCSIDVNLSEFDERKIEYWFEIEDIVGNVVESRHVFVKVDESPPAINSFYNSTDGKYVTFRIDMNETNLYKVEYIDNLKDNSKLKTLCSSLKNGICEKKVSFKDGDHDVEILITDKAGNYASLFTLFFTDSKKPKITKTLPVSRGYASGLFMAEFIEENPVSLVLNYGNGESKAAKFSECEQDRTKTTCLVDVDLSAYNTEMIQYWFTLSDKPGTIAESKKLDVKVDTSMPKITSFENETNFLRRYIYLKLGIEEENFYKTEYWDDGDNRPKWKTLCSSLRYGVCEKKLYLSRGFHDLTIRVSDKAGNYDLKEIPGFTF